MSYRIVVVSLKVWLGEPSRISTRIVTIMPAATDIVSGLPR